MMAREKKPPKGRIRIAAVSGGPDSVYLLRCFFQGSSDLLAAHYNHGARGEESEKDQEFVKKLCVALGIPLESGKTPARSRNIRAGGKNVQADPRGFEERARRDRYAFLRGLKKKVGAETIVMGHTADDQVETVLMRIMEGSGVAGLKGIPRRTEDGIERPLLDTWREEILAHLKKHKIAYRIDRSNFDTRFERNWIRHVLIPLLEKRYGKAVRKRIFALGERFREVDAYIEKNAHNWLMNNIIIDGKKAIRIPRKKYADLPSLLRIRILQILCFERIGKAPNERLLGSMDRLIASGRASARLNVGKGATLRCRYGEAILSLPEPKGKPAVRASRPGRRIRKTKGTKEPFLRMEGPGKYRLDPGETEDSEGGSGIPRVLSWKEQAGIASARTRILGRSGKWAAFDAEAVSVPLTVRPLRAGDRIRPFGLGARKKVKEILIDRKVPREERWGRPVVCDAAGEILWIPGVLRSAHAPVTARTRRTIVLRTDR